MAGIKARAAKPGMAYVRELCRQIVREIEGTGYSADPLEIHIAVSPEERDVFAKIGGERKKICTQRRSKISYTAYDRFSRDYFHFGHPQFDGAFFSTTEVSAGYEPEKEIKKRKNAIVENLKNYFGTDRKVWTRSKIESKDNYMGCVIRVWVEDVFPTHGKGTAQMRLRFGK